MSKKKEHLPSPFHEQPVIDFLKSIDSFFQDAFRNFHFNSGFPVRQYETKNQYIIEAQLLGVKKEHIQLDIFQNYITIGVQNSEIVEETNDLNQSFRRTHSYQKAEKMIMLPFMITEKDIKATYRDGILKIEVPNKRKIIDIE